MDLKQLEYFVRVAELGSFTRASIVLDVAQPALSRQVRLLEVELRQTLLTRNGRGVTVTEAGKVLLEHARGILHQVTRAREALGLVRGSVVGQLALGLPPSLARVLTVRLTRDFRARFPECSLSIREGLSTMMLEALNSGRLDLALVYNAEPSPDFEIEPLLNEALYVIARKGDKAGTRPLPLRDLPKLPLVIPSRPNAIRMQVETELANLGLHSTVALEIDAISAIQELVADGAGYAVLARSAVCSFVQPDAFNVRQIVEPELHARLSIAASSRRPNTLLQQAVIELLRETFETMIGT